MTCRLLICDDNDDDVPLLLRALEATGLSVELIRARDGDEALHYLCGGVAYHLVVLDQRLPRKSGREVLEIARRRGHVPSCPIVVLTSRLGSDSEGLTSLGVKLVLEKPFTLEGYEDIAESLVSLFGSPQL